MNGSALRERGDIRLHPAARGARRLRIPVDEGNPRGPMALWIDRSIRHFSNAWQVGVICVLYLVGATAIALAVTPSILLLLFVEQATAEASLWLRAPALAGAVGLGFFVSGLALLVLLPLYNLVLPTRIRPFRGGYFTIAALPWYVHNGLLYLARYTFLPFVTFTPFGIWFLRAMGMRIGHRVHINTEYISDACLITIGDDAVLGGSVRIFAHYAGGGHLTIAPVSIGPRATIGENVTVMGGVVVDADAVILPHAVLLPGTHVGAGEKWAGVPARRLPGRPRRQG